MKASELRIGNYILISVLDDDRIGFHYEMFSVSSTTIRDAEHYGLEWNAKPIPLTEDILLRFDFERLPWGWVHGTSKEKAVLIRCSKDKFWVELGNGLRIDLPYTHTLQNFFALTGEELILK